MVKATKKTIAFLLATGFLWTATFPSRLFDGSGTVTRADSVAYGVDLAAGRRAAASGSQSGRDPEKATDGNDSTRWAGDNRDDGWIYVDLDNAEKIGKVCLHWEASYATEYLVQVSNDANTWTTVAEVKNSSSLQSKWERQTIVFGDIVEAQFVKIQCVSKALPDYSMSIYDFEVYGPKSLSQGTASVIGCSTSAGGGKSASNMLDGDGLSAYETSVDSGLAKGSGEYIYQADEGYAIVDLNRVQAIDNVRLRWGLCFARRYRLYVSETETNRNGNGWKLVYTTDASLGEAESITFEKQNVRYLKLELIQREVNERYKGNYSGQGGGYLDDHRGMKLYPWNTGYSIRSFEVFDSGEVKAIPIGSELEFSVNAPAWTPMSNISLNPEGLVLAPIGYPLQAKGLTEEDYNNKNVPGFESYATYNPAVIVDDDGVFRMIYRAELPDNLDTYHGGRNEAYGHASTLAYAYSYDGVHFTRGSTQPVVTPNIPEARWGGTEDPRIFRIRDEMGKATYYITFTMYDGSNVREGMVKTTDFKTFSDIIIFAGTATGMKSGTFVVNPEGDAVKIDDPRPGKSGKVYCCIMKDGGVSFMGFTDNVEHIDPADIINLENTGNGSFSDSTNMEKVVKGNESCVAVTNIYGEDDKDIILMYGGTVLSDWDIQYQQPAVNGWFYGLGLAKISKANPFEIVNIDKKDLFEPFMHPTETNKIDGGLFAKCMFADTIVRYNDKWYFYYGAGDMYVGLATSNASFSAPASTYEALGEAGVKATLLAQNRKYGEDKSAMNVRYVTEVYRADGTLISKNSKSFEIVHFSHTPEGEYYTGTEISVSTQLPATGSCYVVTYLTDANGKLLNQKSSYARLANAASVSFGK
ncbi:MAG: discoidin domain-containing protein [Clostridia bacterium]|nr:discoidin domain-containing protein [Clostridia bacterium]